MKIVLRDSAGNVSSVQIKDDPPPAAEVVLRDVDGRVASPGAATGSDPERQEERGDRQISRPRLQAGAYAKPMTNPLKYQPKIANLLVRSGQKRRI